MPIRSVEDAMGEFKKKSLHSGKGGPVVTSRKQAIAIGMSAKRRASRRSTRRGR